MADLGGYADGARIIVRRERPRPGARLSLFDLDEGVRHQVFLTGIPDGEGSLQHLEVGHRAHARVEDRMCQLRQDHRHWPLPLPALHPQPSLAQLSLAATELVAWTKILLLEGELTAAEPKKLRYRELHAAARITRGGRRLRLRIAKAWPSPRSPEWHSSASFCK